MHGNRTFRCDDGKKAVVVAAAGEESFRPDDVVREECVMEVEALRLEGEGHSQVALCVLSASRKTERGYGGGERGRERKMR